MKTIRVAIISRDYSPEGFHLKTALFSPSEDTKVVGFPVERHPLHPLARGALLMLLIKKIEHVEGQEFLVSGTTTSQTGGVFFCDSEV